MRGLALGIDAVHGDFHAVAPSLVDDGSIFPGSGRELGFGLIQFPGAHERMDVRCLRDVQATFPPQWADTEATGLI